MVYKPSQRERESLGWVEKARGRGFGEREGWIHPRNVVLCLLQQRCQYAFTYSDEVDAFVVCVLCVYVSVCSCRATPAAKLNVKIDQKISYKRIACR